MVYMHSMGKSSLPGDGDWGACGADQRDIKLFCWGDFKVCLALEESSKQTRRRGQWIVAAAEAYTDICVSARVAGFIVFCEDASRFFRADFRPHEACSPNNHDLGRQKSAVVKEKETV